MGYYTNVYKMDDEGNFIDLGSPDEVKESIRITFPDVEWQMEKVVGVE